MLLESVGVFAPPHALSMDDRDQVAEHFVSGTEKEKWFVPYIFEKSRVEQRRSVLLNSSEGDLRSRQDFFRPACEYADGNGPTTQQRMVQYEAYASHAALSASRQAIASRGIKANEITHLVTASCTGFAAPGFDLELFSQLPLRSSVSRTHLGFMGCHAGLNCLRTAGAYVAADPEAKVLVCTVELCGLHFQYRGGNDQKIANAIFADGAGAAIVGGSEDREDAWKLAMHGSCVIPETSELMTWKIGDNGFEMGLSESIPKIIRAKAKDWLNEWLARRHLDTESIATWAIHPGGPQILHATEEALGLRSSDLDASWNVLKNYGNMSSATIFFVLEQLMARAAPRPCVALGFGPGLTIEACLFE